jgi:hypothetical protein
MGDLEMRVLQYSCKCARIVSSEGGNGVVMEFAEVLVPAA